MPRIPVEIPAVLAATMLLPASALAHPPGPPAPVAAVLDIGPVATEPVAAATAPAAAWLALGVAAGALLVLAALGRRRGLALALVLLLGVLALEHGAHSVHHLGHPEAACAVSAATGDLAIVLDAAAPVDPLVPSAPGAVPLAAPAPPPAPAAARDPARAPPAPLA